MENNSNQSVSFTKTPIQTQSVSNQVNNQKGFFPIILGVLVLLIAIGGGVYYFGMQQGQSSQQYKQQRTSKNTSLMSNQDITPTQNPFSENDQKNNWQTYTNTEVGYSIKYPAHWVVNAWPIEANSIPKNTQSVNFGKYQLSSSFGEEELKKEGYLIEISVDKDKTLDKVLQENDTLKNRAGYKNEKVTFNGLTAYKISNTGFDFPRDRLILEKDGKVFSISLNYLSSADSEKLEAQKTFNLMLDSFQLIQ